MILVFPPNTHKILTETWKVYVVLSGDLFSIWMYQSLIEHDISSLLSVEHNEFICTFFVGEKIKLRIYMAS